MYIISLVLVVIWAISAFVVSVFVFPALTILPTIDSRLEDISKKKNVLPDLELSDENLSSPTSTPGVKKPVVIGTLVGIVLAGCGLCVFLNGNVYLNKLDFFDNRNLSEKEWNEIQIASRKINAQLVKWRLGKDTLVKSDANTLERWNDENASYETTIGNIEYVGDKEVYELPKLIKVKLLKEYGGCPANTVYKEELIYSSKDGVSFNEIVNGTEHYDFPISYKTKTKSAIKTSDCSAFFSIGETPEKIVLSLPRQETLYLSGWQWGAPVTFNPLADSWMAAWPVGGRFNLVYEPLVTYNTLNGQIEPLLGTLVDELSNNDSIVVDLNPAAKWSDGRQVNSNDVKFIFTKGSINTTEQISDIHVDTIATEPAVQERISFIVNKARRNNPLSVRDLLQAIRIAPAHVFEPLIAKKGLDEVKKLTMDKDPVVSGPYNLKEYSPNYILLERRDDYWGNAALHNGKLPSPKYIVHPIFHSGSQINSALKEGNLDYTMLLVPYVWNYERMGVHAWYKDSPYHVPAAMSMLMINTMKKPLNDKLFRRALAMAIDYSAISTFSVNKGSPQLLPGLIVPTSIEGEFIDKEDTKKYGVNLSFPNEKKRIKAVKKMVAEAGYKSVYKEDGSLDYMEDSLGNPVPTLYITSPAGWTDWESMVTHAVDGMRTAGIDVREKFVDGGEYWSAMGMGNFDLIVHKPAADVSPSLPWSRFYEVMSSRDWQPLGAWAGVNIGRYNQPGSPEFRPEVDQLLSAIPLMTDAEEIAKAYSELNRIFMEDQPAIPLVYYPEQYYEYSDRVWTNWPNEENSYAPPQMPGLGMGTNILWNIRPR